jgi:hypothetical protein
MIALLLAAALALPAPVTGDFDGDLRPDTARLVQRANRAGHDLVIYRGAGGPPALVTHVPDVRNFYLHSGWYRAACIEFNDKMTQACPKMPPTPKDVLMFGSEEASGAMAIWNGKGFDVEWVSD